MTVATGSLRAVRIVILSLAALSLAACTSGGSHRASAPPTGPTKEGSTAAPARARPFDPTTLVGLTVAQAAQRTPKHMCLATDSIDGTALGASRLPCSHGHVVFDIRNGKITKARITSN